MKTYKFSIEMKSIGLGYVKAKNLEEAKTKIANEWWDDIYDEVDTKYGELFNIEIDEDFE